MRRTAFHLLICIAACTTAASLSAENQDAGQRRATAADQAGGQAEDSSFLPAWKLLEQQEKQQFISGYAQGWKDAVKIIDIVISYVKENPERAERALESIKEIYSMSGVRPDQLVHEIDVFYSDPANRNAPLSRAITAAKARAR